MEDENEIGVELPEQLDKERRKREEIEQRVQELEVERNKQRQLEKEKRQRQKAEWREERLEAERQREQCKQRRSQKENQKKSELEQKARRAGMAWSRRVLVYFIFGMCVCFGGVFANCSLFGEKFLPLIMERWKKSKEEVENDRLALIGALITLVVVLFIGDFIYVLFINIFGDFSPAAYHMWINCYDAYPPTPPRLF